MRKMLPFVASCLVLVGSAAAAETLTYVDLVKKLTDLEGLAVLSEPGWKCGQWSSYDRKSRYDEASKKYVDWNANTDGNGSIREEGDKLVLAEMEGPGCIWRIWSAAPDKGHVQILLDGGAAVDLPFINLFDGTSLPFNRPSLVHSSAKGWNCYVPMPYQTSCKIVVDKGWGKFYHVTYGTFPKGTVVPTFHRRLTPEESAALDAADRILSQGAVDPAGSRAKEKVEKQAVEAAPGGTAKVVELAGPEAITAIRVKLDLPASPEDRLVLRELVLKITWDGESKPAVWSPLGDFFGTAAGANKYRSLPMGLTDDGTWYSYWYMPFAKKALVELVNDGKEARKVSFEIAHAPLAVPVEKLGRFHAKWHRDALIPTDPDRFPDWTMLKTEGRGRFCGVMLHVWNPKGGQYLPAGAGRYWWGEGDEKFFVDGEKFPSTFGTGSEDYFGYAWGSPQLFQNAYHNQTISQDNKGHISLNRWHIGDNVPFQKSFEGCIEKYFPNEWPTRYACTAYWYLAPGGNDPYGPVPLADRTGYWEKPSPAASK
ncbi:MAG: glycoside hydrolase family 172 protein [Pirellulales bacterium]